MKRLGLLLVTILFMGQNGQVVAHEGHDFKVMTKVCQEMSGTDCVGPSPIIKEGVGFFIHTEIRDPDIVGVNHRYSVSAFQDGDPWWHDDQGTFHDVDGWSVGFHTVFIQGDLEPGTEYRFDILVELEESPGFFRVSSTHVRVGERPNGVLICEDPDPEPFDFRAHFACGKFMIRGKVATATIGGGVKVSLLSLSGEEVDTTFTDRRGRYSFRFCEKNIFTIRPAAEGVIFHPSAVEVTVGDKKKYKTNFKVIQ